ncbi:hypothetical protein AB0I53_27770 [Saccharopolyspora sp. NPDC050389]|uniref:tetratricopeptide repeat protein n=1 Tax=Saccharopolyspora sp. NPDC050389 TaxID=3155516 RepID=UPI0033D0F50E
MPDEIARNEATGEFTHLLQAGTVNGEVHFHAPHTARTSRPPRPVTEWSPFDLDVHRAIEASRSRAGEVLPELPSYLRRNHDDELDADIREPRRNQMVVLTGGSSTGKTRALYEAIANHEALRNWELHNPRTADELVDRLRSGQVNPRSVLWLNETQNFLTGPNGEEAAAWLLILLDGSIPGPIVVLGTLWPQYWSDLVDTGEHPHARSLLLHSVRRVRVADRFSNEDLEALRSTGPVDPRLSLAISSTGKDRQVIQTLAGGPALVDRHEHPDTAGDRYAAAIVTAVIDARRLGHRDLLSRALLSDAAPGYLDEQDRIDPPEDWFERGIRCAADESLHGITALIPRRHQPGTGPADGYELHDYLNQHGQIARRAALVPDSLWQALLAHTAEPEDLERLTTSAYERLLYRYGQPLYRRYWSSAPPSARERIVDLLAEHGRVDEAVALMPEVGRDPQQDDRLIRPNRHHETVETMLGQGRNEDTASFLQRLIAARLASGWATQWLARVLIDLGRTSDAIEVLEQQLAHGSRENDAGTALSGGNVTPSGILPTGRRPANGNPLAEQLADALASDGRWEQALQLARDHADRGWTRGWLARQFAKAGKADQLRRLVAAGSFEAEWLLAELELARGRTAEALELMEDPVLFHVPPHGASRLVRLLVERDLLDQAIELSTTPHIFLDDEVLRKLVAAIAERRGAESAIAHVQRLLSADPRPAGVDASTLKALLADQLAGLGRWQEIRELLSEGERWARNWLPEHFARNGNLDLLRRLADTGNGTARYELIRLLLDRGDDREAMKLLRSTTISGDVTAQKLARLLADRGKLAELRDRAARGDRHCSQLLVGLAQQAAFPDARRLLRHGLNTDGSTADDA